MVRVAARVEIKLKLGVVDGELRRMISPRLHQAFAMQCQGLIPPSRCGLSTLWR